MSVYSTQHYLKCQASSRVLGSIFNFNGRLYFLREEMVWYSLGYYLWELHITELQRITRVQCNFSPFWKFL